jgi:sulfur carrier protein
MKLPEHPQPAMAQITIQLDGQPRALPVGATLAQLVAELGHQPQAISTAVNGQFVPRALRERALAAGDAVLLFQPIVGG